MTATDDRRRTRPAEMMAVAAARALRDGQVCFVGIGAPSTAANLARAAARPDLVLIYESGTIGAKPSRLPLSIGDGELADTADAVVSVPEIFNYWLQAGRIDVGFLGAAQIDRFANLNTTVVGPYEHPTVRLPGAGGAPEIAACCRRGVHHDAPEPADLCRPSRLPHLGRLRRRAGRPRSASACAAPARPWWSPTSACCTPTRPRAS